MTEKAKEMKSIKRRKRRKQTVWRALLLKDLELSKFQLYQETLQSKMIHQSLELEKKRNFGKDYVR